ncbi:hypothetical protein TNCV_2174031 [Trichonephila clavipes]|nr:hypothetical protein TNCV_2174031 [Trichonephila clavipes]
MGISYRSERRLAKTELGLKPYTFRKVQLLTEKKTNFVEDTENFLDGPQDQKHFGNANLTFQQDWAPVCKAKKAQEWCKANFPDMRSSEELPPTRRLSIPWITVYDPF